MDVDQKKGYSIEVPSVRLDFVLMVEGTYVLTVKNVFPKSKVEEKTIPISSGTFNLGYSKDPFSSSSEIDYELDVETSKLKMVGRNGTNFASWLYYNMKRPINRIDTRTEAYFPQHLIDSYNALFPFEVVVEWSAVFDHPVKKKYVLEKDKFTILVDGYRESRPHRPQGEGRS